MGWVAAQLGHPMPWPTLVVGALTCAGAALAPDLDHKPATISKAFGPLSHALCDVVEKISHAVYNATRMKGDPRRNGGHRTLTHTWPWAVMCGAGASAISVYGGRWGVLAVLFVHLVLAVDGLLWRQVRGASHILVWLLGATGAWLLAGVLDDPGNGRTWLFDQPGQQYMWIGLPVVLGALVHCLGDAITVSGCPILWPIPIGRKRWYPVGPPHFMRFRAGSWVEVKVLMPLFLGAGGIGTMAALGMLN
ncbi:membrane-bound metal-dependent hydrolase [Streptantibioticus cattleyicolor NRRL 8057 = DSM 46488]|uniref:Membrane-bound metal-dependent hydrolase n=1 Tax=Streptantibioticus cattleyicolor (strain ATCC 35852 / DSM 46488 / JCM 4925 / NBRC 14057 / NRRL 8057) TaxID=1003195 RepID=G8X1R3_STREN|nr:membrane-bound metal-dependent hydrolase [Streptantibioticus cattleyicolor NRRL 8057 = DSM 46488]